jgi:hypothetical protein
VPDCRRRAAQSALPGQVDPGVAAVAEWAVGGDGLGGAYPTAADAGVLGSGCAGRAEHTAVGEAATAALAETATAAQPSRAHRGSVNDRMSGLLMPGMDSQGYAEPGPRAVSGWPSTPRTTPSAGRDSTVRNLRRGGGWPTPVLHVPGLSGIASVATASQLPDQRNAGSGGDINVPEFGPVDMHGRLSEGG